jgi:hypothetical protein
VAWGGIGLAPAAASPRGAQTPAPQVYRGLSLAAVAISRSKNVSLRDCPPGGNTQRGVIRPIDDQEFITVTLDVKVLPSFEPAQVPRPALVDAGGAAYNTAQSFTNIASQATFTCDFSFRVPAGAGAVRLVIGEASLDLTHLKR